MKIAALALASALTAVVGSAQPGFAQNIGQNDHNQSNQSQYAQDQNDQDQYDQSDMNGQAQNEDTNDESSTTGQNMNDNNNSKGENRYRQFQNPNNNGNNDNWRNNPMGSNGSNSQNDNDRRWDHHRRMEGRMGPMWHHRMMMGMMRQQSARFSFSNGGARMNVRCPSNESLQDCVQAAGQLLDKISNLTKSGSSSGTSSGNTTGSIPTIPGAVAVPPVETSPTGQ